jgi:hypothetical protein
MNVSVAFFWSIRAATGNDPDSMNTRTINNYMVVGSFEFRKAVAKNCIATWLSKVIRVAAVEYTFMGTRQSTMAQVNDHIRLAKPSRLKKVASPMLNSVIW